MAKTQKPSARTRVRPALAVGAGIMGAVTASVTIVVPAHADNTTYPSWNDVQQAKSNVANQQAMITTITGLISSLQNQVSNAGIQSDKAAEAYFEAQGALQDAAQKETSLQQQAQAAAQQAKVSQMRAGLLASHLVKQGGGNMTTELFLAGGRSGTSAQQLLSQLGTVTHLTAQSQEIYEQATNDTNVAQSLSDQASAAQKVREALATKAAAALATAQAAQNQVQDALAQQQSKSTELVAQLASLKNTSVQVETAYLQGQAQAQAAAAAAAIAQRAAAAAAAASSSGSSSGGAAPSSNNSGSSGSAPAPQNGSGGSGSVGQPNGGVVSAVIAYAEAQLGKPYIFGGSGPVGFDCSGLTMMAYAYAGINIGTHSVNNQWYTAAAQGEIVPYSQRQPGDLVFWGSGPGSFYHVAIYIGGNEIIAAPQEGENVKIQYVWGSPWYQVARPSA